MTSRVGFGGGGSGGGSGRSARGSGGGTGGEQTGGTMDELDTIHDQIRNNTISWRRGLRNVARLLVILALVPGDLQPFAEVINQRSYSLADVAERVDMLLQRIELCDVYISISTLISTHQPVMVDVSRWDEDYAHDVYGLNFLYMLIFMYSQYGDRDSKLFGLTVMNMIKVTVDSIKVLLPTRYLRNHIYWMRYGHFPDFRDGSIVPRQPNSHYNEVVTLALPDEVSVNEEMLARHINTLQPTCRQINNTLYQDIMTIIRNFTNDVLSSMDLLQIMHTDIVNEMFIARAILGSQIRFTSLKLCMLVLASELCSNTCEQIQPFLQGLVMNFDLFVYETVKNYLSQNTQLLSSTLLERFPVTNTFFVFKPEDWLFYVGKRLSHVRTQIKNDLDELMAHRPSHEYLIRLFVDHSPIPDHIIFLDLFRSFRIACAMQTNGTSLIVVSLGCDLIAYVRRKCQNEFMTISVSLRAHSYLIAKKLLFENTILKVYKPLFSAIAERVFMFSAGAVTALNFKIVCGSRNEDIQTLVLVLNMVLNLNSNGCNALRLLVPGFLRSVCTMIPFDENVGQGRNEVDVDQVIGGIHGMEEFHTYFDSFINSRSRPLTIEQRVALRYFCRDLVPMFTRVCDFYDVLYVSVSDQIGEVFSDFLGSGFSWGHRGNMSCKFMMYWHVYEFYTAVRDMFRIFKRQPSVFVECRGLFAQLHDIIHGDLVIVEFSDNHAEDIRGHFVVLHNSMFSSWSKVRQFARRVMNTFYATSLQHDRIEFDWDEFERMLRMR